MEKSKQLMQTLGDQPSTFPCPVCRKQQLMDVDKLTVRYLFSWRDYARFFGKGWML